MELVGQEWTVVSQPLVAAGLGWKLASCCTRVKKSLFRSKTTERTPLGGISGISDKWMLSVVRQSAAASSRCASPS